MLKRINSDIESKDINTYLNNSLSFVSVGINDLLHFIYILFYGNNIVVYFSYQEKQETVLHPGCHTFLITMSL